MELTDAGKVTEENKGQPENAYAPMVVSELPRVAPAKEGQSEKQFWEIVVQAEMSTETRGQFANT